MGICGIYCWAHVLALSIRQHYCEANSIQNHSSFHMSSPDRYDTTGTGPLDTRRSRNNQYASTRSHNNNFLSGDLSHAELMQHAAFIFTGTLNSREEKVIVDQRYATLVRKRRRRHNRTEQQQTGNRELFEKEENAWSNRHIRLNVTIHNVYKQSSSIGDNRGSFNNSRAVYDMFRAHYENFYGLASEDVNNTYRHKYGLQAGQTVHVLLWYAESRPRLRTGSRHDQMKSMSAMNYDNYSSFQLPLGLTGVTSVDLSQVPMKDSNSAATCKSSEVKSNALDDNGSIQSPPQSRAHSDPNLYTFFCFFVDAPTPPRLPHKITRENVTRHMISTNNTHGGTEFFVDFMSYEYLVQHSDRGMYQDSWPLVAQLPKHGDSQSADRNDRDSTIPLTFNAMTPNGILRGDVLDGMN